MSISFERSFSIHDDALLLRGQRSSILAANIANADTPEYKSRDIDFEAVMRKASRADGPVMLASTHRNHIAPRGNNLQTDLLYRNPLHPSLDGNTVDSDYEKSAFTENAIRYQISLSILSKKVSGLIKTLRGE